MATKEIQAVNGEPEPGAYILAIAKKGEDAAASLVKFTNSFNHGWSDFEGPLARLTILCSRIPSLLTDLGTAVNEYSKEISLPDNVARVLCDKILGYFEKIEDDLKLASEEKPDHQGVGLQVTIERLDYNVGASLGEIQKAVFHLLVAAKYLALRKLESEKRITPEQTKELKKISKEACQLDFLRGLMQVKRLVDEAEKVEKTVSFNLENGSSWKGPALDPFRDPVATRRIDDDVQSIDSMDDEQFLDIKEVYESWKLQRTDFNQINSAAPTRSGWNFLGLQVYEYIDCTNWFMNGQPKSQEDLKEENEVVKTGILTPEHKKKLDKLLLATHPRVMQEINFLLEDRQNATRTDRFTRRWQLIDLKPEINSSSWKFWWQPKPTAWEIIIKAETVDGDHPSVPPARWQNPFRKPREIRRPRRVSRGPHHRRDVSPIYFEDPDIPVMRQKRKSKEPYWRQHDGATSVKSFPTTPEKTEKEILAILADMGNHDKESFVLDDW